ncbi:zinc ABC transporter substrate-binding protein [Phascolarctobacterium sp.]|uniref:metal ABC transporter solute-binding protein, Zn/Mn family n=1 Tax=Phascolarctobacterium sp. TaxID=2049039 RepID=UPI00303884DD
MKKFLLLTLSVVLLLAVGCGNETKKEAGGRLPVVASFYPMADFTRQVGGELVQVDTLIADGVEPHDWEPTAKDLTKLGAAKLFVYNGGVEPWAQPALEAVKDKKVASVEAGKGLFDEGVTHVDPHVWLSPRKAVLEVTAITNALVQADPQQATAYKKNSEAFQAKLMELDKRLTAVAAAAPQKMFVTTHAAFGHLAADYGLEQVSIMGISPDAEPTPADLKRLIDTIKEKQVKYVFFETLVSPRVAQTVAEAAGAETLVLDPLEGLSETGRKNGDDYLKIMARNIDNLERALGAK